MKISSVLVVCVGNICRSPLGEHLLAQALPDLQVSSAGIAAVVGADMDPVARRVAMARGHQVPHHEARQLTQGICQAADLILVMESGHLAAVTQQFPFTRGRVFLLAGNSRDNQIPDPYRQSEALHAAAQAQIEAGCDHWVKRLRQLPLAKTLR